MEEVMKINKCIFIFLMGILLTGCGILGDTKEYVVHDEVIERIQVENYDELTERVAEEDDGKIYTIEEEIPADVTYQGVTQEELVSLAIEDETGYAYGCLSENEQVLYLEMLYIFKNLEEDITISTLNTEEIDKVFQCVLLDHPEIFYVDGYTYSRYLENDVLQRITFTGIYLYTAEEVAEREELLEEAVLYYLSELSSDATDYEKVKYVYEMIITKTDYNLEAVDNQNICSVLLTNQSVCQGYAKTMQYLLQKIGIESILVIGSVKDGEGHAWNIVKIDDAYYHVDPTWGDASYEMSEDSYVEVADTLPINYDYLCITSEQIRNTHVISDLLELPECTSLIANYYVMEGAYFTSIDKEKLSILFQQAYADSEAVVTLKCENFVVYQEMLTYLLEEQGIFEYLSEDAASVSYANVEEQLSISFWL